MLADIRSRVRTVRDLSVPPTPGTRRGIAEEAPAASATQVEQIDHHGRHAVARPKSDRACARSATDAIEVMQKLNTLDGRRPTFDPGSTIETHGAQVSRLVTPDVLAPSKESTCPRELGMGGTEQSGGAPVMASAGRRGDPLSNHAGSQKPNEQLGNVPRTEHTYTIADLYLLPAVVPVAVADDILGIGSTLSKGLRAGGEYPVPLLRNRGRHHAVSLASLLAYLGLPLPTPTSTGEALAPEGKLQGRTNVDNGEGTAA